MCPTLTKFVTVMILLIFSQRRESESNVAGHVVAVKAECLKGRHPREKRSINLDQIVVAEVEGSQRRRSVGKDGSIKRAQAVVLEAKCLKRHHPREKLCIKLTQIKLLSRRIIHRNSVVLEKRLPSFNAVSGIPRHVQRGHLLILDGEQARDAANPLQPTVGAVLVSHQGEPEGVVLAMHEPSRKQKGPP